MGTPMPAKGHPTAPKFDGVPRNLEPYFRELELLLQAAQITDDQKKIEQALRYADTDERDLWEQIPEAAANTPPGGQPAYNYTGFKEAVYKFYPGAMSERKFTVQDMEEIVQDRAQSVVRTREELGAYYRQFTKIANFLIGKHRISDTESQRAFLRGFVGAFRQRILNRLGIKNVNHHPDDPYTVKDVYEAADFVLTGAEAAQPSAAMPVVQINQPVAVATQPVIKQEDIDRKIDLKFQQFMQTMLQQQGQGQPSRNNFDSQMRPSYGPWRGAGNGGGGNNNPAGCNWCSEPDHYMNRCPSLDRYVVDGKVLRLANGRHTLLSGMPIHKNLPGKDMREKTDIWLRENGMPLTRDPPPHIQSNIFQVAQEPMEQATESFQLGEGRRSPYITEMIDEDDDPVVDALINQLGETRNQERRKVLENEIADRKRRVREEGIEKPRVLRGERIGPPRSILKRKPEEQPLPKRSQPVSQEIAPKPVPPQYKIQAPIEAKTQIDNVVEKALDSQVMLTQREALAFIPDYRKHVKDLLTNKRTAQANSFTAPIYFQSGPPAADWIEGDWVHEEKSDTAVARHTEKLRAIFPTIGEGIRPECVLDSGSQIVGMRKDVWMKLGNPILSDQIMHMEAANSTVSHTMGVIPNLEFNIGGIKVYMQVQVIEEAPWEVLLGRPFMVLLSAKTQDFRDGSQTITLTDPKSGRTISLPTQAREKNQKDGETGF